MYIAAMNFVMKLRQRVQRDGLMSGFFGAALKMSAVRALIIGLSFVGSVALTRSVGPEGRGLIAWFVAASSIAMMFAQCGVEILNRRYTAENPEMAGGLTVLTLQACLLGTLLTTPFFLYFALSNGIGQKNIPMMIVANISVFFMAVAPCLNSVQLGLNNIKDYMWGTALQKLGNVVMVLALIGGGIISPMNGLVALMLSYMLQVILALYSLRKEIRQRKPGALAFVLRKKGYMFNTYMRNILLMSAAAIVPLLLGLQHSLSSAGWFAACMIIIDSINKTFGMISTYALPQIAGAKNHKEREALKRNVQLVSFWGMLVIAVVWIAIAGFVIPLLLGKEFALAVNTFRILCVYMVFSSLADANQAIVMAGTEKGLIMVPPVVMLGSVVITAWLLIPTYGANGGAIALVAGSFATMAVSWLCARAVRVGAPLQQEVEPETPDQVAN